jgi:hypothetical protein
MWACEIENFSDLLSACDFAQAAIDVFKALQFTEESKPQSSSANALNFVYSNLSQDLVLTQEDRDTLASIKQMAHLFDVSDFDVGHPNIRFFSVDLGDGKTNRSYTQYVIHSSIARKSDYCSAAIFRNCGSVSLSVAYNKASKPKSIYLSEWFELDGADIEAFFVRIGVAGFSSQSGVEFARDLIYLAARDYYTHPLSYEYLRFELDTQEEFLNQIIDKYGDDYIAEAIVEESNKGMDSKDEFDFELIEYELEQLGLAESDDDEDFDDEYSDGAISDGAEGGIRAGEVPQEVLADPVLLLKWLDDHSTERAGEPEHNREVISFINAAGIDYIDHRDKGGCLWIFGGYELSELVEQCKKYGFVFRFKEGGVKATDGFDAWWSRAEE